MICRGNQRICNLMAVTPRVEMRAFSGSAKLLKS